MQAQLGVGIVTGASQGAMSWQRRGETHPAVAHIAVRSLPPHNLIAVEAGRLLDDVRSALDCDLDTATRAAGRLAALLASNHSQDPRLAAARGGLAPWQQRKVKSYVGDHLEGPLPVKELAKLVSLSASHFCRAFKESFGEPPHAYITKARVERARTMMLTTLESLSQIAIACGLADQPHLCRCFRQATGMTPGAWRRSQATGH